MSCYKLAYVVFAVFILSQTCSATYIQMSRTVSAPEVIYEKEFDINITLTNFGDEPAYDVQLSLDLPAGFSKQSAFVGVAEPGVPYTQSFRLTADDSVLSGTYIAVLKVHYADANAYPFSTVGPVVMRYIESTPLTLMAEMSTVNLSSSGGSAKKMVLTVANLDDVPHIVSVRLHIPDELKAQTYSGELEVGAKSSVTKDFQIESFGALAGSSYIVLASLDYDWSSMHYSSVAAGKANIIEGADDDGGLPQWIPGAVLVVLVVSFILYQLGFAFKKGRK